MKSMIIDYDEHGFFMIFGDENLAIEDYQQVIAALFNKEARGVSDSAKKKLLEIAEEGEWPKILIQEMIKAMEGK